ncbi:MAG: methyl-accepting chemotaxis protein [Pseudomonadota bacterium]
MASSTSASTPAPAPAPASTSRFRHGLLVKLTLAGLAATSLAAAPLIVAAIDHLDRSTAAVLAARGEAIAASLAAVAERSTEGESTMIQSLIDQHRFGYGVQYILVRGPDRRVVADYTAASLSAAAVREALDRINPVGGSLQQRGEWVSLGSPAGKPDVLDVGVLIGNGARGSVHVGLSGDSIRAQTETGRRRLVWAGVLGVVLGGAGVLLAACALVLRPIRRMAATIDAITPGASDSRVTVDSPGSGELAELAQSISRLLGNTRELAARACESGKAMSSLLVDLIAASREQGDSVGSQTAALVDVKEASDKLKQAWSKMSQKAAAILRAAERADQAGRAGLGAAIEKSLTGFGEIRSQVEDIAHTVGELEERTRQIGLITQAVKDLADQSNMLALNAAIEAVRSGEHGKGFAVVAREIRSLADQSIQATDRVREILDEVGDAIRQAIALTERGTQRMDTGLADARALGDGFQTLSSLVDKNVEGIRDLAADLAAYDAGMDSVVRAVSGLLKSQEGVARRVEQVSREADALQTVAVKLSGPPCS